jgi:hypothetical protein
MLDVNFREDGCRARKDNSPKNLNILRKAALSRLRAVDGGRRVSAVALDHKCNDIETSKVLRYTIPMSVNTACKDRVFSPLFSGPDTLREFYSALQGGY